MPIVAKLVHLQKRLQLLKVTRPDVGHVTNRQNYISTFARLMVTKFGRVVTSERMFRLQTRKSSPTSCLFSFEQKPHPNSSHALINSKQKRIFVKQYPRFLFKYNTGHLGTSFKDMTKKIQLLRGCLHISIKFKQ